MNRFFTRLGRRLRRGWEWLTRTPERRQTEVRTNTNGMNLPPGVDRANPLAAQVNTAPSTQTIFWWEKTAEEIARLREYEVDDLRADHEALQVARTRAAQADEEIGRRSKQILDAEKQRDGHLASLSVEQRALLGRRISRPVAVTVILAATVLEYWAFRTTLLFFDFTDAESYVMGLFVLIPVLAADYTGHLLKDATIRRADPEAETTLLSWGPSMVMAAVVLVFHFAFAWLRQQGFLLQSSSFSMPFPFFMIMTLSATLAAGLAAYRRSNRLQDRVDELDAAVELASTRRETAVRRREAEQEAAARAWAAIEATRASYYAQRSTVLAHGQMLIARIRLANPPLWGLRGDEHQPIDTVTSAMPNIEPPDLADAPPADIHPSGADTAYAGADADEFIDIREPEPAAEADDDQAPVAPTAA